MFSSPPTQRSRSSRCWWACSALALLASTLGTPARAQEPFERALAEYEAQRDYPALGLRARAWERLVHTGDARAVALLERDAARTPGPHVAEGRHLLAASLLSLPAGVSAQALDALASWVERDAFFSDPWALHCALRALCVAGRTDAARRRIEARDPTVQVAALAALAVAAPPREALACARQVATSARGQPAWRHARGCAALEAVLAGWPTEPAGAREVTHLLIDLMELRGTERRTVARLAQGLAELLGGDPAERDPRVWRARLDRAAPAPTDGADAEGGDDPGRTRTRAGGRRGEPARFMSLVATGRRVVYVLDMSDSMLEPLEDGERTRVRPLTGGDPRARRIDWGGRGGPTGPGRAERARGGRGARGGGAHAGAQGLLSPRGSQVGRAT